MEPHQGRWGCLTDRPAGEVSNRAAAGHPTDPKEVEADTVLEPVGDEVERRPVSFRSHKPQEAGSGGALGGRGFLLSWLILGARLGDAFQDGEQLNRNKLPTNHKVHT